MNGKLKIAGIATGVVLLIGVTSWVFTAPYAGNEGLQRTPGVRIGGTARIGKPKALSRVTIT